MYLCIRSLRLRAFYCQYDPFQHGNNGRCRHDYFSKNTDESGSNNYRKYYWRNGTIVCILVYCEKDGLGRSFPQGGFGVPVANLLFAPSTPICAAKPASVPVYLFGHFHVLRGRASVSNPQVIRFLIFFLQIKKCFGNLFAFRSRRDSNPRYLSAQRFSRPPPSTARTPLQYYQLYKKTASLVQSIYGN